MRVLNWYRFISNLALLLFIFCRDCSATIKCPLKWVRRASGDALPESVIPVTFDKSQLIIRGQTSLNGPSDYTIGKFESGKGYFPLDSNRAVKLDVYEVLTNPHGCMTKWTFGNANSPHKIPSHPNSDKFVGRTVSLHGLTLFYISGQVRGNQITYASSSSASSTSSVFQVLESYYPGLKLQLRNFVFGDDAFSPSNEFVGIDMIFNRGDTEIKQTITQKKSILQKTVTTSSSTWSKSSEIKLSVESEMKLIDNNRTKASVTPHLDLSYERKNESENENELVKEEEIIIEVTREVIVPPFTSVQVCSTVTVCNNFDVRYIARAEYTAPGLTGQEVKDILGSSGRIEGHMVVVDQYEGRLQGSLALNTKFFVTETDNTSGCSGISTAIADLKRDMAFGRIDKSEYNTRNDKINAMIRQQKLH